MKTTSILIVTYNSASTIEECLLSLQKQTFKDFEVILIDNDSSDNTRQVIESIKPLVGYPLKTSYRNINLGFAGGNQFALQNATGRYIALLNPDTVPDCRWLAELMQAIDSCPDIGIYASKIVIYGTNFTDSAGDGFSTSLKGFKRGEGEAASLFNRAEYAFGACAGAALYRRKMIDEIDFLDEDFFLIHEDTDLNLRAQLHGWKVLYVPTAIVHHKVRSSIGPMSNTAVYYTLRNSELVRIKNIPLAIFIRCFPEFIMGIVTEFVYFAIKQRRLKLYCKAKRDAIRMLPEMLKKRAVIMKNRKVNNRYLLNIMTSVWQKDFLVAKIKKFLHE